MTMLAETVGIEAMGPAAEELEWPARRGLTVAAWFAIAWLVLVLVCAIFAPHIPGLASPNRIYDTPEVIARSAPFTVSGHPLGGDASSRDVLARLVYGARATLEISFGAVAIGIVIGGFLGLAAGFYGKWVDSLVSGVSSALLAIPALLLAITFVTFLAPQPDPTGALVPRSIGFWDITGTWSIILALGLVSIPILALVTRTSARSWSQREFVVAARSQGARGIRIMLREVLPNVLPALGAIALLGVGIAMIAEAGLAILGLGVPPPTPSWGSMLAFGVPNLADDPWLVFIPSIAIFLTVLSLNYLGDVIRERFDVRESAL